MDPWRTAVELAIRISMDGTVAISAPPPPRRPLNRVLSRAHRGGEAGSAGYRTGEKG
jgi:hypothetical protein